MPGLWQTVCGKVKANESSIEACKRETTEETGLDLPSEKMKFIFNDRKYDCDVYITKIHSDQQPKRTEPDKMSAWKPVTSAGNGTGQCPWTGRPGLSRPWT